MTNQERRAALAEARKKAVQYARAADRFKLLTVDGVGEPEVVESTLKRREHIMQLASMWAHVADALKDGDPAHDSVVDLEPAPFSTGIITR